MKKEECCPRFNPKPWDKKTFAWKDKKFIKGNVFTFFYIPVNFGNVITKLMKKIDSAGAECSGWMTLSEHNSKWSMGLYVAVNKYIKGSNNISITGKFLSKVYEGSFKDTGKWCEDFNKYAKEKRLNIEKQYMWYTTCPKCAKKYGKNYVVIIGKIK